MKELVRLSERVYYYPFEEERDRPLLGYVKGDRLSLAVDAGHSAAHVEEFYRALDVAGLKRPDITVLTHWHWDHTFGMHAVHGVTVANARTTEYLKDLQKRMGPELQAEFKEKEPTIALEYADGQPMVVVPADIVFTGTLELNLGGVHVRLFQAESAHTDDSTLVLVPEEKILFMGDSMSGEYPTWEVDPDRMNKLLAMLRDVPADIFLTGHWTEQTKEEVLQRMEESIPDRY